MLEEDPKGRVFDRETLADSWLSASHFNIESTEVVFGVLNHEIESMKGFSDLLVATRE